MIGFIEEIRDEATVKEITERRKLQQHKLKALPLIKKVILRSTGIVRV